MTRRIARPALGRTGQLVDGRGKYMSNISKSNNSHKITLSLFIERKREVLQISFDELANYICEKAFEDKSATHVVTEVLWGVNIFAMFEQQNTNHDEREAIEGELTAELRKAGPLLSGGVKADLEAEGVAKSKLNNLHIEFSGDLEMTGVPTTIPEALNMIKTIPDSISKMNDGKGVQIQFILSPIKDVIRYVHSAFKSPFENMILREANNGLVRVIQFTFDELLILEQKMNHLVTLSSKYRDGHLPKDDVREMNLEKIRMEIAIDDFRRRLAILLKDLRKSTTVEQEEKFAQEITNLVKQQYQIGSNETEQFLMKYKSIQKKCQVLEQLISMNVECLELEEKFHESPNKDVYILITSYYLFKNDLSQFERKYNEFIMLIDQKKEACFVFHDTNDVRFTSTKIDHYSKKPFGGES